MKADIRQRKNEAKLREYLARLQKNTSACPSEAFLSKNNGGATRLTNQAANCNEMKAKVKRTKVIQNSELRNNAK
jgi:hypothetical protein